jgi:predicted permease
VLLIAIVNVATLSLVRASAREPELALRVTLGAGRLRLIRLPLVEGLTIGAASAVAALTLAAVGLRLLVRVGANIPRLDEVALDAGTVVIAVIAALVCGIVVNASPAFTALRTAGRAAWRGDLRRTGVDRNTTRLRSALVMLEFALALPLLLGASLLFRSFLHLQAVDPGFDPSGVISISTSLPATRYAEYEDVQEFWRQAEQLAANVPGISAVGISTELPPRDAYDINNFNLTDRPVPPGAAEPLAPWLAVTEGYFDALGVSLTEGRMFAAGDSGAAPPVVLVSRSWAAQYYPGESAVGRQMVPGGCTECPLTTVIGVVEDVKYLGLMEDAGAVYVPLAQAQPRTAHVVTRARTSPASTFSSLRDVVSSLDSELPVEEETMVARINDALSGPQRSTVVLSASSASCRTRYVAANAKSGCGSPLGPNPEQSCR